MTAVERGPTVPAAPRLGAAVRSAAADLFYNSWRLVPANLVWGIGLLALVITWQAGAPLLALLLCPLLGLPTIGLYRLAGLVARGQMVSLSDAFEAWRRFGVRALGLGAAFTMLGAMFGFNVVFGLSRGDTLGWVIATTAAWGLVFTAVTACVAWPLAADPRREEMSLRGIARLALLLVIAFPLRFAAFTVLVAIVLVASTLGLVTLLMVSMAFVALFSARFVLPAADRFAPPTESD